MKLLKIEYIFVFVLLIVTVLLRFPQLGYSHFYGDETKVLYLDKTVSAKDFFFDQRKGPGQFLVAWVTEKVTGNYSEFAMRIPFAVAGTFSVFAFYILVKKLFGCKVAFISAFLYSINGLYIAFSRTVQYQSFMLLFGFLSIFFAWRFFEGKNVKNLFVSAVFFSLSFLFHYDALFFAIPILFLVIGVDKLKNCWRSIFLYYVLPALLLISLFYLPYTLKGYLATNTFGYVLKRLYGKEYVPNYSPYTFLVYNPLALGLIPLIFGFLAFLKKMDYKKRMLAFWFLVPFVVFQFFIANPGTHIHNYLIPLLILASVEIVDIVESLKVRPLKYGFVASLIFVVYLALLSNAFVYLPFFNAGYPWRPTKFSFFNFRQVDKSKHLFLYGFPYNRGWDQIREYLLAKEGVRTVYTNDNATIAEYYLRELDISPPGPNFEPQYYVYVFDNQELKLPPQGFLVKYELEREFWVDGTLSALLYRKL